MLRVTVEVLPPEGERKTIEVITIERFATSVEFASSAGKVTLGEEVCVLVNFRAFTDKAMGMVVSLRRIPEPSVPPLAQEAKTEEKERGPYR